MAKYFREFTFPDRPEIILAKWVEIKNSI